MYTYCTIQFVDDGTTLDVIIKSFDDEDEYDELIFFYGLSANKLRTACENKQVIEGEWIVLSVGESFDYLF